MARHEPETWLKPAEAARMLNVSPRSLEEMRTTVPGLLRAVRRIGTGRCARVRFCLADLVAYQKSARAVRRREPVAGEVKS